MKALWPVPLACLLATTHAMAAQADLSHTDVFVSGKDGYHAYRIPALETAPDGSLLAFAEARKYNLGDPGMEKNEIDLVLKRSTDRGHTWSAMKVIEHAGQRWSAANPATVVDGQNGRVWLHYLRCKPDRNTDTARPGTDDVQNLVRSSDDNGVTWSAPTDLTPIVRDMSDKQWRSSVVGPGGAIQDRKGRLVAAVWKYAPWGVFAIYSEDHGRTWKRGQPVPGDRWGRREPIGRVGRWSALDGLPAAEWPAPLDDYQQRRWPDLVRAPSRPGRYPGVLRIERYTLKASGDDRNRILWTGPKGPGRTKLVIRVSYDEAGTFPNERPISEESAAYSDLAVLKDKTVGVLWEAQETTSSSRSRG